ncbi:MAG TPA: ATP-binding protein [Bryobacteraceae bacterium]|jgi:two-component system phosphate regulon sensor histidine kinase PhoR|nr:ATP-binding protein [Bryobacteraceae bacterium]
MGTTIRFRMFLSCFALIAGIVLVVDLTAPAAVEVNRANRIILELILSFLGGIVLTWVFARAIEWRIQRLKVFTEHVLDSNNMNAPLPEEGEETILLNQSLRRMASRIRELVDRLSLESSRRDAILRSMAEGVLAVDHHMRVLFCNQALSDALGLKQPVAENTPLVGLVRDPKFLSLISEVLASGEPVKSKLQFAVEDSSIFEAYAAPLEVPPHRGALVILHDITGMERLERIRRDFVANVSHELRTPLTAIRGYAETLLSGALSDTDNNRRFVEIIQAHAIRLNNIASDLLTLSDLESGRRDAEPGPISVEEAINTAVLTVETEARIRGVNLVRGAVKDSFITGHALRLEQALVNLLDNAVKFNHLGGEARIDSGVTSDGRVFISVADTGSGIPSDDVPRIFERFYRVDRARSREVGGTGLGLSIVKHVVERMEGSIKVESRLGKGTTFTIILPPSPESLAA